MWIMSRAGFFSAVVDKGDPNTVVVRARVRADLASLRAMVKPAGKRPRIVETPAADYQFRMRVTRRAWGRLLATLADDMDYANFKDAVKAVDPGRAAAYTQVWATLRSRLDGRPPLGERRESAPARPSDYYAPVGEAEQDLLLEWFRRNK